MQWLMRLRVRALQGCVSLMRRSCAGVRQYDAASMMIGERAAMILEDSA